MPTRVFPLQSCNTFQVSVLSRPKQSLYKKGHIVMEIVVSQSQKSVQM